MSISVSTDLRAESFVLGDNAATGILTGTAEVVGDSTGGSILWVFTEPDDVALPWRAVRLLSFHARSAVAVVSEVDGRLSVNGKRRIDAAGEFEQDSGGCVIQAGETGVVGTDGRSLALTVPSRWFLPAVQGASGVLRTGGASLYLRNANVEGVTFTAVCALQFLDLRDPMAMDLLMRPLPLFG